MANAPAPPLPGPDDPRTLNFIRLGTDPPTNETAWRLTGGHRLRRSWWGRIMLQVEEYRMIYRPTTLGYTPTAWQPEFRWRDARMDDLGSVATKAPD